MLVGLPDKAMDKLQRVQNMMAKIVLNRSRFRSTTEALKSLHWLPIRQRIDYKILTLIHKCLIDKAPDYLKSLLVIPPKSERNLRSSSDTTKLIIPRTKCMTFAARSFSVIGPAKWNSLPRDLRAIDSHEVFRKPLKTYLFKFSFN